MRYIARHYVRVGQARYTPGEMLNLEDSAAEEAPEEAEETEEDETQERQTNVTPDIDVSAAIVKRPAKGRRKS